MTTTEVRLRMQVWSPADPTAVRGTVLAFSGRGEHTGVYTQLGARLAADGYRVHVTEPGGCPGEAHRLFAEQSGARFLLGVDTGALLAMQMAEQLAPEALVLASLPGDPEWTPAGEISWEDEIALRAVDPIRRAALRDDPLMRPGELLREAADQPSIEVSAPALVLHGESDVLSPSLVARHRVVRWPRSRFVTVASSGHDVLHDTHERSVAAEIVQFLERFRIGGAPVLRASIRSTL